MTSLVTVIVTAYNVEPYVGQALESVLAQSHEPLEVVVVDDGSTDRTGAVCSRFADRIHYVRQANRGAAAARNTAIRHARGELLAFLDGDDLWDREHVATQVAAAVRFPLSGLIASNGIEFAGDRIVKPSLLTSVGADLIRRSTTPVWHGTCYAELLAGTPISTASQVMVPRRVFEAVGLWDSRFRVSHDYDLYLRIAARFPITLVGHSSVNWRRRSDGLSGPDDLRYFNWRRDVAAILRKQLATADPAHRPLIQHLLQARVGEIALETYYRGHRRDRLWAIGYLTRLAVTSRRPHLVIPYLAGLICPAPIRRLGARRARRVTGLSMPGRSATETAFASRDTAGLCHPLDRD